MEVPQQSHGPHGEAGGHRACHAKEAHRVEAPVLMVHEPIERVGGAMGAREAIRAGELLPFAAELQDHQPDYAFGQVRCGPLGDGGSPLGELRLSERVLKASQTWSRTSVRICRSRTQRSAILRTEWRKHKMMHTAGKRLPPGALRAPSQPSVHTVFGL